MLFAVNSPGNCFCQHLQLDKQIITIQTLKSVSLKLNCFLLSPFQSWHFIYNFLNLYNVSVSIEDPWRFSRTWYVFLWLITKTTAQKMKKSAPLQTKAWLFTFSSILGAKIMANDGGHTAGLIFSQNFKKKRQTLP